jgi:hypothetical protein
MSTPQYTQYVEKTLQLAKTLTIKSEASCIGINNHMKALGVVLSDDPRTWKYYLNLAGEYHPTDQPMEVLSLDTLETIPFTKDALKDHVVTRESYLPGSTTTNWDSVKANAYYVTLVERYPGQELLIRGILQPVDLETAVNAENHQILFIDTNLIESNETNLLWELQTRISAYLVRWDNPSYAVADDLYVTAYLGVLYCQLPGWLFNIRLANCKTGYAHSFHIREYLKSHNHLDTYFDYLTKKQMLFLYRNILYLENNAGKQDTFEWLSEKLLTDRGIGLAEYRLHHNLAELPEAIHVTPEFKRYKLNSYHRSSVIEQHQFEELLLKERPIAAQNLYVEKKTIEQDIPRIQNAKRCNFPTKVLESALIDWSESGVLLRTQFLLYHWAYWGTTGKYKAVIRVYHPVTSEPLELTPKEAFILFLYAYNRSVGVTLDTIPNITAQAIRRQPGPSKATLTALIEPSALSEQVLQLASQSQFSTDNILSPYQFVKQVDTLFKTFYSHREVYAVQEDQRIRAQYQAVMDHLYADIDTAFVDTETLYSDWLYERNLDAEDWSDLETATISKDLYESATGINLVGTYSPSDIQRAMVGLLTQLSSYSIQFIREVNPGPIVFWEWSAIRLGAFIVTGLGEYKLRLLGKNLNSLETVGHIGIPWVVKEQQQYHFTRYDRLTLPQRNPFSGVTRSIDALRLPVARVRFAIVAEE